MSKIAFKSTGDKQNFDIINKYRVSSLIRIKSILFSNLKSFSRMIKKMHEFYTGILKSVITIKTLFTTTRKHMQVIIDYILIYRKGSSSS